MAIRGVSLPTTPSEIEPVVVQRGPAGPGAAPALQSSSGLAGRRGMPPDATRRRASLPAMAAAQAGVPLNQGVSPPRQTLRDLFRMADEEEKERRTLRPEPGRRFDSAFDRDNLQRALRHWDVPGSLPASSGPDASRRMGAPAGHGVPQPVVGEASGGSGQPAAPGPHTAGSSAASAAAAPLQQPGQSSLPAGDPPSIPAKRKVSFAFAEQRMFDRDDGDPKALGEPVRVPFPSEAVLAARGKSAARSSSADAQANMAANEAVKIARSDYATQLSLAVGRLLGLAIESPERVQQALRVGILPAEVRGDNLLDPRSIQDVLDLYAQFQEWQARAPAFGGTDFRDAGGIAQAIVQERGGFVARRALGIETSPPEPQPFNTDQIATMTAALNGGSQALRRLRERAGRASPKTVRDLVRRIGHNKPRALEGTRRQDFVALVDRDIAALVAKLSVEPRHAAALLQRAVRVGQLGSDALRPQDRALLLDVLAAKASDGDG